MIVSCVFLYFLENDLLKFCQTNKKWRQFCCDEKMFDKRLIRENELTETVLDAEYNMLVSTFGEIGKYFYYILYNITLHFPHKAPKYTLIYR